MKETLKHKKAFELYYAMGNNRSLEKLETKLKLNKDHNTTNIWNLKKWSQEFKWQDRIMERDNKNARALMKITDQEVVKVKAEYRRMIREAIEKIVHKTLQKDGTEKTEIDLTIESVSDFERLVKLDLLLVGEPTEIQKQLTDKERIDKIMMLLKVGMERMGEN